jgi:hypothetical protein
MTIHAWKKTSAATVVEMRPQDALMPMLVTLTQRSRAMMVHATLVHAPAAPIQQHVTTYRMHLSMMDHANLIHVPDVLTQQHVTSMPQLQ